MYIATYRPFDIKEGDYEVLSFPNGSLKTHATRKAACEHILWHAKHWGRDIDNYLTCGYEVYELKEAYWENVAFDLKRARERAADAERGPMDMIGYDDLVIENEALTEKVEALEMDIRGIERARDDFKLCHTQKARELEAEMDKVDKIREIVGSDEPAVGNGTDSP